MQPRGINYGSSNRISLRQFCHIDIILDFRSPLLHHYCLVVICNTTSGYKSAVMRKTTTGEHRSAATQSAAGTKYTEHVEQYPSPAEEGSLFCEPVAVRAALLITLGFVCAPTFCTRNCAFKYITILKHCIDKT